MVKWIKIKKEVKRTPLYIVILLAVVVTVGPLLWIVSTSVKSNKYLYSYPPQLISPESTIKGYQYLITKGHFGIAIFNSLVVSLVTTFIVLMLAGLAAYGFSRYKFKYKSIILLVVLGTQMLPGVINIIPYFTMMARLNLLNTLTALYLILAAINLPFAVWLLKGFFDSIPRSIDESALVDGANRLVVFFKIIVPLGAPGFVAAGVFSFLASWNEFTLPLILTSTTSKRVATLALYLFKTPHQTNWAGVAAGSVMTMIPIIVLFLYFNRYFVYGWKGAVKE